MREQLSWICAALSAAMMIVYELQLLRIARRDPAAIARSAHLIMRGEWVRALSAQPGSEILAVQALRNSLMSATITASTAAIALTGSVSLLMSNRSAELPSTQPLSLRLLLDVALVLTLFAAHVCAAMAMRYYHHAGFALSLPVGSPERGKREPLATAYVQRAGILYSWSLRCFLFTAPIAIGLLMPLLMPLAALGLLLVLWLFDTTPKRMTR